MDFLLIIIPQFGAFYSSTTNYLLPNTSCIGGTHLPTSQGIAVVGCTNDSVMHSPASGCLVFCKLPAAAHTFHTFNDIDLPILLVPNICAHCYTVNFNLH